MVTESANWPHSQAHSSSGMRLMSVTTGGTCRLGVG